MTDCLKIIVKGRVQGVYFRAYTQKQAGKLKITGYAKNLSNGDVEIVACGEKKRIEELVAWCHKGPMLAKVTCVETYSITDNINHTGFDVR